MEFKVKHASVVALRENKWKTSKGGKFFTEKIACLLCESKRIAQFEQVLVCVVEGIRKAIS